MKNNKSFTIGLHIWISHYCMFIKSDGEIVAAIAEERLTRVKYHMGFPFQAIEKVIQIANIKSEVVL